MKRVSVTLEPRTLGKKSEIKRRRSEGFIPVEIYGKGVDNVHAWISARDFMNFPHGETFLVEATVGKDKRVCILKDIQFGWLGDNPIHIDLYDLSNVTEIDVEVPIEFTGKPQGVELGGTFEILMHTLTIRVKPSEMPDRITVDVSELGLGEALHVRDITVPEGLVVLDNPEETVAVVVEPEAEVEEEEKAEETAEGGEETAQQTSE